MFRSTRLIARCRWLVAATALLGTVVALSPGSTLGAPTPRPPNILIFLTDDQRDSGSMVSMPAVRRVFGRGGTKFSNGYVTTPQCCPSRASIYTGQYAHNTGVISSDGSDFDATDTWQRHLQDRGYFTGLIGKYLNGVSTLDAPHFDYLNVGRKRIEPEQATVANAVKTFFSRAEATDGRPWALVLATHSPHAPWTTMPTHPRPVPPFEPPYKPRSYQEADRTDKHPSVRRQHSTDQFLRDVYRSQQLETQAADDEFAQLWRVIRHRREAGNLLAFFLSDNGYAWGDHGLSKKGEPYLEDSEVPFYVRWPGQFGAGTTDTRLVANIDIAPTIYQAVGIKPDYTVDGDSLLGPWRRPWLLLEFLYPNSRRVPPWRAYVAPGKRHYIQWLDGFVEDYNLRRDPAEMRARNVARPRIAAKLEAASTCRGAACP